MMLCDDQLMSVANNSPKGAAGSLNSSASSVASSLDVKGTWADEVLRAEANRGDICPQSMFGVKQEPQETKFDVKQEPQETETNKATQKRDIALEFIDDVNEEKFVRLVKEEKLKTPFKRRHSNTPSSGDSRSNSPNSSNDDVEGAPNASNVGRKYFSNRKEEKRLRRNSHTSSSSSSSYTESDPAVLARRQKQIDYGKNTVAYERYVDTVPRVQRTRDHPRTPNKHGKYSRRAFDGLVKIWRKQLHYYDPPRDDDKLKTEATSSDDSDSD